MQNKPNAKRIEMRGGHVVFNHVDFSYVKGRKILRDNSFEVLPEKIGLCGPTGAVKSTIINILTRYYDIDSGTITIDGRTSPLSHRRACARISPPCCRSRFSFRTR